MPDVYHRDIVSSRSTVQEEMLLLGMTLGIHSNVQTTDKETLPRELVDGDIQGCDAVPRDSGMVLVYQGLDRTVGQHWIYDFKSSRCYGSDGIITRFVSPSYNNDDRTRNRTITKNSSRLYLNQRTGGVIDLVAIFQRLYSLRNSIWITSIAGYSFRAVACMRRKS